MNEENEGLALYSVAMIPKDATASALQLARRVLEIESDAVRALIPRLDERFLAAVSLILACKGRVIVSGIGKSGHVARKIASTLSSTGTPAYFVHPTEASHGDLGMIQRDDVFIGISYSGESDELLQIVPLVKRQGAKLVVIAGNAASSLAREANVFLDAAVAQEACPLNLAPTASTTAALALGDALAVALLDARGFSADDFARSHPGGSLGRKLLTHVADVMRTGEAVPMVGAGATLADAVLEISRKGMGMTAVVDADRVYRTISEYKQILDRISDLVDEEHRLRSRRMAGEVTSEEEWSRLRDLEESLDQCWDLLRRRRAAREFGGDPNTVQPRGTSEVEGYIE